MVLEQAVEDVATVAAEDKMAANACQVWENYRVREANVTKEAGGQRKGA
jgi:hypothetical protein